MQGIIVRPAIVNDALAMIGYVNKVAGETDYLTFGMGEFEISESEERRLIELATNSKTMIYLLAIEEKTGEIIGNLSFLGYKRKRRAHAGELGISVYKRYWGKGVSTALFNGLFTWIEKHRLIRKITLQVRYDNLRAIRLYEKIGFVHEGKISRGTVVNGVFYDMLVMGREIDFD